MIRENPETTVYIGNVAPSISKVHIAKLLEHKLPDANVKTIRVMLDETSGRSNGTAFITFSTEEEAVLASIFLNGEPLRGRPLEVLPLS